ncbi:unnamed protein product [Callosobruchus maculatus]|uniref:Uncharacterized protein n=1 Tax=Callosobruchus maculatus TaxID=64391 RepID=A0A653CYV4_CALMS|nr:unnamed protein product [Callosobruchus maculatus]
MLMATIILCFSLSSLILFGYHIILKICSDRSGGVCKNSPYKALDLLGKLPTIYSSDFNEILENDPVRIRPLTEHLPTIIAKTVRKRSKSTQNHGRHQSEERTVVRKTKSHADLTAPAHNVTLKRRLSEM